MFKVNNKEIRANKVRGLFSSVFDVNFELSFACWVLFLEFLCIEIKG